MKDIFVYMSFESWNKSSPDAVLKGTVSSKNGDIVEIYDDKGFVQLINMSKVFAVVY